MVGIKKENNLEEGSMNKISNKVKFVYFGSSDFSKAIIEGLYQAGYKPSLVVSRPDMPRGRGLKLRKTEVSLFAESKKIRLIKPQSLKNSNIEEKLSQENPDFFILADYGKIIPAVILSIPKIMPLCVHPSLLPKYRGSSPIENTLMNGDSQTGITIFKMNERIDAGEIILRKNISVEDSDDFFSLKQKFVKEGIGALIEAIKKISNKDYVLTAQDEREATFTFKFKKEDGRISWKRNVKDIRNLTRAILEWPTAYTYHKNMMIKILEASVVDKDTSEFPGTIIGIGKKGIEVAASNGVLNIKRLKPQGKKEMSAWAFSCGHKIKAGDKFL